MLPDQAIEAAGQAEPTGWLYYAVATYTILQPILWPAIVALMGYGVALLRKRGFQATYAAAIARALGAGIMACQDNGVDPLSIAGRKALVKAGAQYLQDHVGTEGKALGIDTLEGHGIRVEAELGSVIAKATAGAQAAAALGVAVNKVSGQTEFGLGGH